MKVYQLFCFAAAGLLLAQGCKKNKVTEHTGTTDTTKTPPDTTKTVAVALKIEGGGDHGTFQVFCPAKGGSSEIPNTSLDNYTTPDLALYTGVAHQNWRIALQANGYFKIMNMGSGKFLQSFSNLGSQQLIQNSDDNADDQLWAITTTDQSGYETMNKASGLAITAPPDTGKLTLAPYKGSSLQLWGYAQLPDGAYRDDAVVNFFHRPKIANTTVAFDQGNSIALADGRVLWVAEDTYSASLLQSNGQFLCGQIFDYHNSALLQPASHSWDPTLTPNMTTTNSPINPLEIIKSPGDHNTTYSWPGIGIEVNGHVYMYCYESANGSTAPTTVLYDFTESAGTNWGNPVRTTPAGMAGTITYTEGMVRPGDGYVYVYGNVGVFLSKNIYVARFPESNPQSWTFWDGSTWAASPTASQAAIITVGSGNVAQANTAVSYINGKYVMMQMDLGYFCDPASHNIYMSTATSPTGPFTAPKQVFTITDMINGHICRYYTPSIHPEEDNGHSELLVTYCLNYNAAGGSCSTNTCINGAMSPNYYQVKGVRIPYSLFGL